MVGSRAATRSETTGGGQTRYTVVGLFDDQLDMQDALAALRKANQPPEQISVVAVYSEAGEDSRAERALAVARAVAATALDHVGSWLQGLAELIVPERGTFVVAGPLGAALAGIGSGDVQASVPLPGTAATPPASDPSPGPSAAALVRTLQEFGFGADDATYVESRLAAGAPLIGVTAVNQVELQRVRRILAEHNAVHIGMARTDARIADQAQALLAAPPERSSGGDVVVTDAVAPLRRLCDCDSTGWSAELCGRDVVELDGTYVRS